MRIRLAVTVLAVTGMVMIAFLLPLGAVVRVAAEDRASTAAEQEARSLASVLSAVTDQARLAVVVDQLNTASPRTAAVFLPDGTRVGPAVAAPDSEFALARTGRAFTASGGGDRRVWVPVHTADGNVTVGVVRVPSSELHRGVVRAWSLLALVGVLIVALGTALADRLGRSMVVSVERLGHVTRQLHQGDLDARVSPSGPSEIVTVGEAVNELAERIQDLLAAEREQIADLSHRLRTPLTALQLEAEALPPGPERERLTASVSTLTDAVSELIWQARRPRAAPAAPGDVAAVVRDRLAFWAVLAEDQDRAWDTDVVDGAVLVPVGADELAAAVDALLANVFAHTDEGVGFRVTVRVEERQAVLVVADDGPGFGSAVATRGRSGGGSTGLGLDIARQAAERAGGTMTITDGPGGLVTLVLPLAAQ
jgi:signal transduction histidine kinase